MSTKRIVFAVMCVLLALTVILTGIVVHKVTEMFGGLLGFGSSMNPTEGTETTPTQATEPPTEAPTEKPTEPPTEPPTEGPHVHEMVVSYSKSATCNAEGYTISKCSCGKTEVRYSSPKGHSYGASQVVPPTCTQGGCTVRLCSRCGNSEVSDETAPLGHDLSILEEVAATCTVDAHTIRRCSREGCKEAEIDYILGTSKGGHKFTTVLEHVSATCTEDGYTLRQCANEGCSDTEKVELPATGHNFSQWADSPNGGLESTCANEGCGITITASQLHVTKESVAELDQCKHYIIEVGTATIQQLFIYEIEDHLMNGTLVYQYDAEDGLVITYTDAEGNPVTRALPAHSDGTLVIEGAIPTEPQDPTAPTEDTDAAQEPTSPSEPT